jgi:glyoxylase-like metal-dependent hydrolase (beta-lactamase superfamily II)
MKTSSFLALAIALGWATAAHARPDVDPAKVTITVEKLAPGLAVLRGQGGNIGVCYGDDGVFLIDDEFAPLAPKIRAAVEGLSKKPLRFVVNTHWHGDHTGGNEPMATAGAVIVAQDNVYTRLSTEQFSAFRNDKTPPAPHAALPVVTFATELSFHLNGDEARVIHVEHAHTDGDSIVWFKKADVVHMGDTFFTIGYPYIDVDSGGSIDGYIAAADRVLAMADDKTQIIPGHGATADKKQLKTWRDMLATLRTRIAALKQAGKSLAEVQAAKPSAEFDAKFGHAFIEPDDIVEFIYKTIGGPAKQTGGPAVQHH